MKKLAIAFCFRGPGSAGYWDGSARASHFPPVRSACRNAAAKGILRLAIVSLIAILSLLAVPVPASAQSIDTFTKCVKDKLEAAKTNNTPVNISTTVACTRVQCEWNIKPR